MKKTALVTGIKLLVMAVFLFCAFTACKKHNNSSPSQDSTGTGGNTTALSDEDSLKYYMYHYMQVSAFAGYVINYQNPASYPSIPLYYWYSQVPSLDPLSTNYDSAENLLSTIISYPKNPQTGGQIDRYSFLDRSGAESALLQNGVSGDMGFQPVYAYDNSNNLVLIVEYVYGNSSAGEQGVQRGWQITAINGNTNISDQNLAVNAIYYSNSAQFTFKKPDGSSVTLTIDATNYAVNPVLFDTVYTLSNNKKVGYFVFNQFIDINTYDSLGNVTGNSLTKTALDNVFNMFTDSGVNDIIVDLRYNGGGSVNTAEFLDDELAPSSATGQLMYQLDYNNVMSANASSLGLTTKVNFGTAAGFNLDHLFFITSRNTASASELTLNNLVPYRDVQIIGDTTYGKPFEDFDWSIKDFNSSHQLQNLGDLFVVVGHTANSAGNGSYYLGIPPNYYEQDYVGYNWGDPNDPNLQDIFKYLTTGSYRMAANYRLAHPGAGFRVIPNSFKIRQPKIMTDFPLSRKLYLNMRKSFLK